MGTTKPTLCWKCQNANCGCSWSQSFKPVKRWKAIPTVIKCHAGYSGKSGSAETTTASFLVVKCPEFKRDEVRHSDERASNT